MFWMHGGPVMAEAMPDGSHMFSCRVYYEDTDAGGIVYYANYLRFAERARSELLRDMGTDNTRLMRDHGVMFAVRECTVRYREPARLDDALQIHTRIARIGGASFSAIQRIERSTLVNRLVPEADRAVGQAPRGPDGAARLSRRGGPARADAGGASGGIRGSDRKAPTGGRALAGGRNGTKHR